MRALELRRRIALRVMAAVLGFCCALGSAARAEGDWSAEFEAVCGKTQDAMSLSTDELRSLVARCDKLKGDIQALDDSRRKVYGKRLQLCRDLYEFMLQTREKG